MTKICIVLQERERLAKRLQGGKTQKGCIYNGADYLEVVLMLGILREFLMFSSVSMVFIFPM